MADEPRRWAFLEDNAAVTSPGWIPQASECPELAHLRADHERLLAIKAELEQVGREARKEFDEAQEARVVALADGFLSGDGVLEADTPTITEADVQEAALRAEAATDALQIFTQRALAEANELAPSLHEGLDEKVRAAETKREEAKQLLSEADIQVAETKRLRFWLRRITGESKLGQYPYEDMPVPMPQPPLDLEAVLGGKSATEVMVVHG